MMDASLHLPAAFLHEAFSDRSGVPPDHFELYYRGKRLEGEAALASWGVGKDATIEVKMRGRGGMKAQVPEEEPPSSANVYGNEKAVTESSVTGKSRSVSDALMPTAEENVAEEKAAEAREAEETKEEKVAGSVEQFPVLEPGDGNHSSQVSIEELPTAAKDNDELPAKPMRKLIEDVRKLLFLSPKQAKEPSQLLISLSAAAVALMHAFPIGIVQFADYASDIGVIITFFEKGDDASGWLGLGFIIASIAVVWIAALFTIIVVLYETYNEKHRKFKPEAPESEEEEPEKDETKVRALVEEKDKLEKEEMLERRQEAWDLAKLALGSALLAPFNLHTLYLAVMIAKSRARLQTIAAESTVSPERWQALDDAKSALDEAYRARNKRLIKTAEIQVDKAKKAIDFKKYFTEESRGDTAEALFVLSKAVETGLEALPLSVLTASALFSGEVPGSFGLFASSLGLSVLSMAYGLFGGCCKMHELLSENKDTINPTKGHQGKLFLCILVNVAWTILATGLAYGSLDEPWRYVLPLAVFLLVFLAGMFFGFTAFLHQLISTAYSQLWSPKTLGPLQMGFEKKERKMMTFRRLGCMVFRVGGILKSAVSVGLQKF